MTATDQPDDVVREVFAAARPETVFGFFTDPALMIRWQGHPGGTRSATRRHLPGQHRWATHRVRDVSGGDAPRAHRLFSLGFGRAKPAWCGPANRPSKSRSSRKVRAPGCASAIPVCPQTSAKSTLAVGPIIWRVSFRPEPRKTPVRTLASRRQPMAAHHALAPWSPVRERSGGGHPALLRHRQRHRPDPAPDPIPPGTQHVV